ncbi:LPS translocon maturation chaperone LptM [Oceanobacter kriegii]|nr:lipoprotein [Oceanobacter kriegii]
MKHLLRTRTLWLATLAVSALLLGGCGQKGPLYLPDQPDTEQTS